MSDYDEDDVRDHRDLPHGQAEWGAHPFKNLSDPVRERLLNGDWTTIGWSRTDDNNLVRHRQRYHALLKMAFDGSPELHGKIWRPRHDISETINPFANYIPMSFSMTLLDLVGGLERLRKYWEPES